ncbi:MAG: PLP-dependent aminotransferase family protein [Deltaproteobacteria bacterium]|nr:PLP-dependent aminotransferase family protein [Deltaproteobacteria bacterium]
MNIQKLLADRTRKMSVNTIREILKVVSQPGMVSLAGGIPAPESFPIDILKILTQKVLEKYGPSALQYDPTEGFSPLREALPGYLAAKRGIQAKPEDILIASGSQGVLDAAGKIFISRNDPIAVEAPTYLGALQAFDPYEPRYVTLVSDAYGLVPESLEEVLAREPIKFIYLVPTFQNPTGRTIPLERRRHIADIIQIHDALLIEDDPYGDLRYSGQALPVIKTLAPEHVIYVSTLSKVFAPGLRIGYYLAPKKIRDWLVMVKQGVDLHTSTFNQALAAEYIQGGYLEQHLPHIIELYKPRKDAMLGALQRYFPEGFTWSKPEGGMFVWVEGPENYDMQELYHRCVQQNVAFVPGKFFYSDPEVGNHTMRLNFTMADEATIDGAVKKLAEIIAAPHV